MVWHRALVATFVIFAAGLLVHLPASSQRAQGSQASAPITLGSVTLARQISPENAAVLPLPVRLYRPKRTLEAYQSSAEFELPAGWKSGTWVVFSENLQDGGTLSVNHQHSRFHPPPPAPVRL
jgi:hypothetical protein